MWAPWKTEQRKFIFWKSYHSLLIFVPFWLAISVRSSRISSAFRIEIVLVACSVAQCTMHSRHNKRAINAMRMKTTWGNSAIHTRHWHTGHWEIMIIGDTIIKKEGNFLVNCYRLMCKCVNCVHTTHRHTARQYCSNTKFNLLQGQRTLDLRLSISLIHSHFVYRCSTCMSCFCSSPCAANTFW